MFLRLDALELSNGSFQNAERRFACRVGDQVNMILFGQYFNLGDSLTTLSIRPFLWG